jgi:hypothetical protein
MRLTHWGPRCPGEAEVAVGEMHQAKRSVHVRGSRHWRHDQSLQRWPAYSEGQRGQDTGCPKGYQGYLQRGPCQIGPEPLTEQSWSCGSLA